MANRVRYDILAECLNVISNGAESATHIMYGASLSFQQLQSVRADFVKYGLAELDESNRWRITTKGVELIGAVRKVQELLV